MNIYQWIVIGTCITLAMVVIVFRKTPWVQKTWKILAIVIPPIVILILMALKNKTSTPPTVPTSPPTPPPTVPIVPPQAPSVIVVGVDYQISPRFSYGMLTKTEHRDFIEENRKQGQKYLRNMANLCNNVLEPVWNLMGPISINSCFRCPGLNALIGGSINSQHMDAEAADTEYAGITLQQAFNKIAFSDIKYSQVILEFNQWIHVGVPDEILHPGKVGQKFIASREKQTDGTFKTIYTPVTKPLVLNFDSLSLKS
jgi:zinc D-Ala-D-Ala carboxypeptidase